MFFIHIHSTCAGSYFFESTQFNLLCSDILVADYSYNNIVNP